MSNIGPYPEICSFLTLHLSSAGIQSSTEDSNHKTQYMTRCQGGKVSASPSEPQWWLNQWRGGGWHSPSESLKRWKRAALESWMIFRKWNKSMKSWEFSQQSILQPFLFWQRPWYMLRLEKEMATHSSVLAWRIPGTGEPSGLPSTGLQRDRHDWSDLAAAAERLSRRLKQCLRYKILPARWEEFPEQRDTTKALILLMVWLAFLMTSSPLHQSIPPCPATHVIYIIYSSPSRASMDSWRPEGTVLQAQSAV